MQRGSIVIEVDSIIETDWLNKPKKLETLLNLLKNLDEFCRAKDDFEAALEMSKNRLKEVPVGHDASFEAVIDERISYCLSLMCPNSEWEELVVIAYQLKEIELAFSFGIQDHRREADVIPALQAWVRIDRKMANQLSQRYFVGEPLLQEYIERCFQA